MPKKGMKLSNCQFANNISASSYTHDGDGVVKTGNLMLKRRLHVHVGFFDAMRKSVHLCAYILQ